MAILAYQGTWDAQDSTPASHIDALDSYWPTTVGTPLRDRLPRQRVPHRRPAASAPDKLPKRYANLRHQQNRCGDVPKGRPCPSTHHATQPSIGEPERGLREEARGRSGSARGVGGSRGRRDSVNLQVGNAVDFWRVEAVEPR